MSDLFTTASGRINYTAEELFRIAMTAGEEGNVKAFNAIWHIASIVANTTRKRDTRIELDIHPATVKLIYRYGG